MNSSRTPSMPAQWLLGLLAFALFTALGLLAVPGVPSETSLAARRPENWQLEPWPEPPAEARLSLLLTAPLWGSPPPAPGTPAPQEAPRTPPDWRIGGVVLSRGVQQLVIVTAGKPDRFLQVGDLLPGGARILGVNADAVDILLNGKRLSLSIHSS